MRRYSVLLWIAVVAAGCGSGTDDSMNPMEHTAKQVKLKSETEKELRDMAKKRKDETEKIIDGIGKGK
ncbi:MAG: hypothetical protein ABSE73_32540 [Planctomycetota bacterium]